MRPSPTSDGAVTARAPSRARRRLAMLDPPAPPTIRRSVVAAHYGHRDFWTRRLLATADACGLVIALVVSGAFGEVGGPSTRVLWALVALPLWIVLFKTYGLYDRDYKRVSHGTVDDIPWVFHAVLVGTLLLWLYFKFALDRHLILAESLTLAVTAFTAVLLLRSAVRSTVTRLVRHDRVLLVGQGAMTDVLLRKMRAHREYGLNPVGVITAAEGPAPSSISTVGRLDDLADIVLNQQIDRIVISPDGLDDRAQLELLHGCRELSVKVSLLPQMFETMGPSIEVDDVEGVTLLGLNPPVLSRSSRFMKRALDLVGSSVLLVVAAPLMLVIAIAIKLNSRGPVFFKQKRVGKDGRPLQLIKFRTMCEDAEERTEELRRFSRDPNWLHIDNDPRHTKIGRFLRHLSLDELPQLFNVLKGEMSLVGPRPLIESEDRQIDGWARGRLHLTPGITGSWQVLGRTNIPFAEMVKLDYLYVTNWSLWGDVRLIMRTLPAVVTRRGAN